MSKPAESHCFRNPYSFRIDGLPFARIKGQSRLFLDYQQDPEGLRGFLPGAMSGHSKLSERIPDVLGRYEVNRSDLAEALLSQNLRYGCGRKAIENINLLKDSDCVAVVTGQQAGLFSGPLYTIYKALSAIRLVECLRNRGFKAVPVFWIATEDHDLKEISRTSVINKAGTRSDISIFDDALKVGPSIGRMTLDSDVRKAVEQLMVELPATEFSEDLHSALSDSWSQGTEIGEAFGKFLTWVLGDRGLIMMCPLDERIKRLASPIYVRAIEKSSEIIGEAIVRSNALVSSGYHAQVHISDDYFPFFIEEEDGVRTALRRQGDGSLVTRDGKFTFSLGDLAGIAQREPSRLSPGVLMRAVVQDYLLPTLAYFGGAAEIAYFAQAGGSYRILDRTAPTVFHRQSFTLIDSKNEKTLTQFGLSLEKMFEGTDVLCPQIVEAQLNAETAHAFANVEEEIGKQLDALSAALSEVDKSLSENMEKRRRKIEYHLVTLRRKFHEAQLRKDEAVKKRIDGLFASLLPDGHLQERTLNVCGFVNRYGRTVCDWLYEAIDLDDPNHRIVHL